MSEKVRSLQEQVDIIYSLSMEIPSLQELLRAAEAVYGQVLLPVRASIGSAFRRDAQIYRTWRG
jgi:hypothetical protein